MQKNNLLVIGYVWPEPNSSAAGTRMLQLLQLFKKQGTQIIFASPAKQGEHKIDLTQLGIQEQVISVNDSHFDEFLAQIDPGLVIFDRFMMEEQFGWRVEKVCPQAVRILNTEDCHSLRDARHQLLKQAIQSNHLKDAFYPQTALSPANLKSILSQSDLAMREIAAIHRSDLTLMISDFEAQLLQKHFQVPHSHLMTLPFLYEKMALKPFLPFTPFNQRQHFIWIGNFRHAPNWDAVLTLKTLWPKIKQACPDAECHIYGAYLPKKASQLHNKAQRFLIKGWADDSLKAIQQARVMLAPIRFGAGIKGKLAEAMQVGTPSITTSIGAEAMTLNHATWNGAICETSTEFIQQAIHYYQDESAWRIAQTQGQALFTQNYLQTQTHTQTLLHTLKTIQAHLTEHRNQHFIGKMLNHHHHKSTQYMSQWIEAKNKT